MVQTGIIACRALANSAGSSCEGITMQRCLTCANKNPAAAGAYSYFVLAFWHGGGNEAAKQRAGTAGEVMSQCNASALMSHQ